MALSATETDRTTTDAILDESDGRGDGGVPSINPDATLTGANKRHYVRGMFTRIASRYDLMNFIMSFGQDGRWRAATIRLALPPSQAVARDTRALDLGAGTGLIAQGLARRGAHAVAVDLTPDMMRAGMERGVGRGEKVDFVAGDALRLPFPDGAFDCVTTGFMMRNVTDIEEAFSEMRRVLKPGGRLVCLEVGRPRLASARFFHKLYTRKVVPVLGRLIAGDADAYRYLPSSMGHFPPPPELASIMRAAGLRSVRFKQLSFGAVAIHWAVR